MEQYVKNIRKLRENKQLSQAYVARILGTTQQVYSKYELGENELPIRHLIKLCKLYKVSSDEILGI